MEAIVVAGGDPVDARWAPVLPRDAFVVAADSGLDRARELGLAVDLVVGDLDSVDPDHLAAATTAGVRVERHPTDKDATDLELALAAARSEGATSVTVLATGGGRLDHFLANALLLAAPRWATLAVTALVGDARATVVRSHTTLSGEQGSLLTLLALGGPASGVTTTGLRWSLHDARLEPGSTRGVSNEMTGPVATVTVGAGVVLAVQPDALPHALDPAPRATRSGGR